jgi:hypothetical protein
LLKGLARFELALRKRPVTSCFAIDARDFDASAGYKSSDNAAGRSNEIVGSVPRNNELTRQEVHAANGR